ncbi:MAG TPA: glycosyltransferase family 2 protein [Gaiellaceae bacterium]|jgi:glycosyltransferase involved in cell wall biosynthesis
MTLVSIVTPSFNQAAYIREALDSVRAQTHRPVEHVVVDGGSTDGTLEILESYDGIRWVSEPDRGQSHALNKGFALAQGEILGWLNADDAYAPQAVERGVAAIRDSGAALVYADVTRVNDGGIDPRRIRSRATFDLWTELNLGCGIYSPAVFFTREALEAAGGIDEGLHLTMDYDLWLRIGKRFPVEHVDEVWATQRIHPEAKTKTYDFWPERLTVSRRHGGRFVSPLLIRRYVRSPRAQRAVGRAVSAAYAALGRRPG